MVRKAITTDSSPLGQFSFPKPPTRKSRRKKKDRNSPPPRFSSTTLLLLSIAAAVVIKKRIRYVTSLSFPLPSSASTLTHHPLRNEPPPGLAVEHVGAAPSVEEEVLALCHILDVNLAAAVDPGEDTILSVSYAAPQ